MSTLTQAHWTHIAELAVQAYGLPDAQLTWLSQTHNTVFNVTTDDKRYVLRLQIVDEGHIEWLRSELTFLRILYDMTNLSVPYPNFTRLGEPYAQISVEGYPKIHAVLFNHLDGESPSPTSIIPEELRKIGAFLGRLHQSSPPFPSPKGFQRPMLDWQGLFGSESIYDPDEGKELFTDDMKRIITRVTEQVQRVMDKLGKAKIQFGMIHGDLLTKNILFHEGDVSALDFEYCGWGYFLYDLAPLLWQFKIEPMYAELEEALWDGYINVRPQMALHREVLEPLIAARHVASIRWIAKNQHHPYVKGKALNIVEQRIAELKHFLTTGFLQREDTQP